MAGVVAVAPKELPPGYRFHPTDQELIIYFLMGKVLGLGLHNGFNFNFIPEVHVYRFEPHQLPDKSFSPSAGDPGAKLEWYFFAPRGRKYPNGLRMERATDGGFWKSTGKDRPVMHNGVVVGMKKTLVFHTGRAPNGMKTDWVMHEYRLHPHRRIHDAYALCRVFNKKTMTPLPDMDNKGIQPMTGNVNSNKEEIHHPVLDDANADREGLQPLSAIIPDVDNEGMHSVPNAPDMDKEGIHPVSVGDGTDKEKIQPVLHIANADMERIHPVPDGAVANNEAPGGTNTDVDNTQMLFTFDNAFHTSANVDMDFSWMQFVPDDIGCPSIELGIDDSVTQLIEDYLW